MRILILEDEPLVAKNIEKLVRQVFSDVIIQGPLVSVENALAWFAQQAEPDLILADIQLADGISFDIFQELNLACPIIFTTAYDEYAIRAFKLNSIDYLLKPIDKQELERAFEKLERWKNTAQKELFPQQLRDLLNDLGNRSAKKYKHRFTAHYQRSVVAVPDTRIAYFVRDEIIWTLLQLIINDLLQTTSR